MFRNLSAMLMFGLAMVPTVFADDTIPGRLIFSDDFERSETDETKEQIGHGWATNSKKRAGGHKQVDLVDGAMHIFIHKSADHAVSVTHPAEFRNGTVQLKFKLLSEKDNLGLNFADLQCKDVWAGHLFVVRVGTDSIQLQDLKTGNMDLRIRELRMAKKLTPEQKKLLAQKQKRFPVKVKPNVWYTLRVDVDGDQVVAFIDGKEVGRFSSPGIAHPTKRLLRLSVPHQAVVDDVRIYVRD